MNAAVATATAVIRADAARRRAPSEALLKVGLGVVGVAALIAVWEIAPRVGLIDIRFFPPASQVLATLLEQVVTARFWTAVGLTMLAWLIGLAIPTAVACVMGLAIGTTPFLRRFTRSTIEFLRPIPSVGLIPLAVLLFGIGMESSVMLIAYACFWQVLVQVLYGTADVDAVLRATARVYGMGPLARMRRVVVPTMLPYLMTGIRLAATVALVLAITTQMIIGSPGLGQEIVNAQSSAQVPTLYALVLFTGFLGIAINAGSRAAERHLLRWHASVRAEVRQ